MKNILAFSAALLLCAPAYGIRESSVNINQKKPSSGWQKAKLLVFSTFVASGAINCYAHNPISQIISGRHENVKASTSSIYYRSLGIYRLSGIALWGMLAYEHYQKLKNN